MCIYVSKSLYVIECQLRQTSIHLTSDFDHSNTSKTPAAKWHALLMQAGAVPQKFIASSKQPFYCSLTCIISVLRHFTWLRDSRVATIKRVTVIVVLSPGMSRKREKLPDISGWLVRTFLNTYSACIESLSFCSTSKLKIDRTSVPSKVYKHSAALVKQMNTQQL